MANGKSDVGRNMMIAGIDQDRAEAVDFYSRISPSERGELALWLTGKNGSLRDAPDWVLHSASFFASIGFMEAGIDWSGRQ